MLLIIMIILVKVFDPMNWFKLFIFITLSCVKLDSERNADEGVCPYDITFNQKILLSS